MAHGFPAPKFTKTTGALPKGVAWNAAAATFSGTPKAGTAGSYLIGITATNGFGVDADLRDHRVVDARRPRGVSQIQVVRS